MIVFKGPPIKFITPCIETLHPEPSLLTLNRRPESLSPRYAKFHLHLALFENINTELLVKPRQEKLLTAQRPTQQNRPEAQISKSLSTGLSTRSPDFPCGLATHVASFLLEHSTTICCGFLGTSRNLNP